MNPLIGELRSIPLRPVMSIDLDTSTSSDSYCDEEAVSPMEIFRDSPAGGEPDVDSDLMVRRANPVNERRVMEVELLLAGNCSSGCRVISPYPYPQDDELDDRNDDHNQECFGSEQVEEREPFWRRYSDSPQKVVEPMDFQEAAEHQPINYTHYFAFASSNSAYVEQPVLECDDFSLSSHEANSLSDEDLGDISDNPEIFWEGSLEEIDEALAGPEPSNKETLPTQNILLFPTQAKTAPLASIYPHDTKDEALQDFRIPVMSFSPLSR